MAIRNLNFFLLILLLPSIIAFNLPGFAPNEFCRIPLSESKCKSKLEVFVNHLDSVESVLPYEYSYFPFCTVNDEPSPVGNLGQVLFGERIRPSPYKFDFLRSDDCHHVCTKKFTSTDANQQKMLQRLMKGVLLGYQQNWKVDNMPITLCYKNSENQEFCSRHFPIGCYVTKNGQSKESCNIRDGINDTFYIFNHLDFEITYHSGQGEKWGTAFGEEGGRIISAKVQVNSLNSDRCDRSSEPVMFQSTSKDVEIPFTYSVKFIKNNDISWASRWDYILNSFPQARIQWFAILNSFVTILFFSGIVSIILLHILCKDNPRWSRIVGAATVNDEFRWKLINGDAFRPPSKGMLLSILVGNGVQIAMTLLITLVFASLDFLSPAKPGALVTCLILCYVLLGSSAGYTSSRLYKMFGGANWQKIGLMTAIICPSFIFSILFGLNLVLWGNDSSAGISCPRFLVLLGLWLCILTPLVLIGACLGFKHPIPENLVSTNQIPRQASKQSLFAKPLFGIILLGGILPFCCIFIQLFFILNSIWAHQYYYYFGFLLIAYILLIIICSETTILICYFYLHAEDYNWWWRSFLASGFTAAYFFLYSVYYFATKLEISDGVSTLLYFGYTLILTLVLFLFTGTIGFLACFWFLRLIYSVVKLDLMKQISIING